MSRHQSFWNAVWYLLALKSFIGRSILTLISYLQNVTPFTVLLLFHFVRRLFLFIRDRAGTKKSMTNDDTSSPFCLSLTAQTKIAPLISLLLKCILKMLIVSLATMARGRPINPCVHRKMHPPKCVREIAGPGFGWLVSLWESSQTTVVYLHSNETHGAHVEWQRCPAGILIQRSIAKNK